MNKVPNSPITSNEPLAEATPIGPQYVMAGYKPVTAKERLEQMAGLPMQPKRQCRQKPCNIGLFDEDARCQMELF